MTSKTIPSARRPAGAVSDSAMHIQELCGQPVVANPRLSASKKAPSSVQSEAVQVAETQTRRWGRPVAVVASLAILALGVSAVASHTHEEKPHAEAISIASV